MTNLRRRVRFGIALALGLLMPGGLLAATGDATGGACVSVCAKTMRACRTQSKLARADARANCKDMGGDKECLRAAVLDAKSGVRDCRATYVVCRDCCQGGGTVATCVPGCAGEPAASTFAAIEQVVFEKRGCTQQACHNSQAKQGGLDLTPGKAYANLFDEPSEASALPRVAPGDARRSFLWLKLAAATDPDEVPASVAVGTPMPSGLPPISPDELEAIRMWIYAGAPEADTVDGTQALLDACLPEPRPLRIKPLPPPGKGKGVQFTMPPFALPNQSETELCYASYYDVTDQVPDKYKDPSGQFFYWDSQELRQDASSHHLILSLFGGGPESVTDPAWGPWTCRGGSQHGEACDPTVLDACGDRGTCATTPEVTFACIGYGPPAPGFGANRIGGAQKAQNLSEFPAGVYAPLPLKGVLLWNPHAFNLTDRDTVMHGWLNYYFADERQHLVRGIFDASRIFAANAAPFTKQTLCHSFTLPQGAHLYELSSHTHRHGELFWIDAPDGTRLYENRVYNDPPALEFNPPLVFDSPVRSERTLSYCAIYNNGLTDDGGFDTELVTRASRVPPSAPAFSRCVPTACVAGKIGAACSGASDHATCDSAPGAGDGNCDACPITGGESTENEMFIAIGQYYLP